MQGRRAFLISTARVAGGLILASCAAGAPAATAPVANTRGTLKWGASQGDIIGLEPFHSTDVGALQIFNSLYDGVASRDANYKLQPRLAESWKLLNNTTWQFKLRPDVKFHNGDPLTSADVKFTIDYLNDPKSKTLYLSSFATLDRIEIIDNLTFNIVSKTPDPFLPDKLSVRPSYIIPANHFTKVGFDAFNKAPIGTGPYAFKDQTQGTRLTLSANKNYWRTPAYADEIIMLPRPENAARIAGLKSGELNFIDLVPFDQVDDINASPNAKVVVEKTTTIANYVINALVAPLDKKLVRQALSLAVDRDAMNKAFYKGTLPIANSPLLSSEYGYDSSIPPYPYDPAKAKSLLQQAGYNNEKIVLEITSGLNPFLDQAVGEAWRSVGLNIEQRTIDPAAAAQKRAAKSFLGIYYGGTASLYGDPNGVIWRQLGPGGTHRYWSSAEFDALGKEQESSLDPARRKVIIQRMVAIMADEMPWINLWGTSRVYGMAKNVDWQPGYSITDEFHPERLRFK